MMCRLHCPTLVATFFLQVLEEEVDATSVARMVTLLAIAHSPVARGPEVGDVTNVAERVTSLEIALSHLPAVPEVVPVTSVGRRVTLLATAPSSHQEIVSTVAAVCVCKI